MAERNDQRRERELTPIPLSNAITNYELEEYNKIVKYCSIHPDELTHSDTKIHTCDYCIIHEGLYKSKVVAIKELQPEKPSNMISEADRELKFRKEIRFLNAIIHRNVVEFIGVCLQPRMIITEFLGTGTLQNYLSTRPLDLSTSVTFALDIARAMHMVHSLQITHCDLNPDFIAANILLTEDTHVKITGLANARSLKSEENIYIGNLRYLAPEVNHDPAVVFKPSTKVDVYSFSLILWELLTHDPLYKDDEDFDAHRNNGVSFENERPNCTKVKNYFVPLLRACWHKDPTKRPEFEKITCYLLKHQQDLFHENQKKLAKLSLIQNPETSSLLTEAVPTGETSRATGAGWAAGWAGWCCFSGGGSSN